MNENLFAALREAFPADLDATAIETADGTPLRYSWRDLERATAMLANLLASLDLPAGARVAVQTEKSVEALLLYLAVLRAGFVYLPLNSAYQTAELEYFIGNAEPSVVVCTPERFARISKIAFKAGTAHVFTLGAEREGSLLERAAHHADKHTPAIRNADELAAILYTSGTTGRSKGAMLSHGNLLSNARTLQKYWGWRPGDVLIHALPIFHVHGLFVASHGALLNGSKMLWFSRFDAKAVVARLPDATVFMGVPTLYVRLLAEPGLTREACSHMRLFISGSAPLLLETFEQFRERTGHTILERYGMSETVMLTSNPYFEAEGERIGGTVGFALPGVGVRVVDEKGAPCSADTIGALEVSGPNVFSGYWRMPEKTREEFTDDGYFRTGDLGELLPRATVFMGVPTLYVRLLAEPTLSREACRNMRLFISGSAPLLLDTFEAFRERTGHTILERYGMSETVMLTSNPYEPGDGERRGGTVGFPLPGVGLRIVDGDGAVLPQGTVGAIEVRGPNVFAGYWRMPEKTRAEFSADGWFRTGDVGVVDDLGYVSIVGRSKDLIISGGYNVYPAEIEGVCNELPGVAETAVVGVPHSDFGEAVVAVVVPRAGATVDPDALTSALKAKIANFKVPKAVFVVAELPRNAMGKVQKNLLREQHATLFAG